MNLEEKIKELDNPWSPIEIASFNDQVVRLALFRGEYHWHQHENEDEFFYLVKGQIIIQIKDQEDIELASGEMAVVPKGVEHCPNSEGDSYVIMIEPKGLESEGD